MILLNSAFIVEINSAVAKVLPNFLSLVLLSRFNLIAIFCFDKMHFFTTVWLFNVPYFLSIDIFIGSQE